MGERLKPDKRGDLMKEYYFRTYSREFEFLLDKARDILELHGLLEEAKSIIKE
jgi:hypothetical protein